MRGLIQRVTEARVSVEGQCIGAINQGLLLLLGIEQADNLVRLDKLLEKILNYRLFADSQGKMNLSLLDIKGDILVVSQFTLVADTSKGLRPGFSAAAKPDEARVLYQQFIDRLRPYEKEGITVATGEFAADMQVSLVNDGPVTFWLTS